MTNFSPTAESYDQDDRTESAVDQENGHAGSEFDQEEEGHTESAVEQENDTQADNAQEEFEAAARKEAARDGFIRIRSQNMLIMGAGGSGKTSTMSVMFGEKPPDEYTSTGVCESSKRAACVSGLPKQLVRDVESANRILFSDGKFTWLAGDQLLQLIARGANACLPEIREKREALMASLEPSSDRSGQLQGMDSSDSAVPNPLLGDSPNQTIGEAQPVDSPSIGFPSVSPEQILTSDSSGQTLNDLDPVDSACGALRSPLAGDSSDQMLSEVGPLESTGDAMPGGSSNRWSSEIEGVDSTKCASRISSVLHDPSLGGNEPLDSTGSALPSPLPGASPKYNSGPMKSTALPSASTNDSLIQNLNMIERGDSPSALHSSLPVDSTDQKLGELGPLEFTGSALPSDSSDQRLGEIETLNSTAGDSPDQKFTNLPLSDSETTTLDSDFQDHALASEVLTRVAELMKDPSTEPLAEVDVLHIVDSGGQLQFHEILQKFVVDAVIFVTDVTTDPNSKVKDLFFVDGKPIGEFYESHYTHEQLFKRSLQALQLQSHSTKLAVVATHIDEIDKDKQNEKISEINTWVLTVAESAKMSSKHFIYRGDALSDIVYPLQANNPSQSDKEMAQKLLTHLRSDVAVKPVDIPLRRFLLEQTMREVGKKSRGVISLKECYCIAQYFKIESVDSALQYLSDLNLILYVPEVIDDIVFCEVQTPLSALKQLVQYSAKVRADSEVRDAPSADLNPANLSLLATHGIVTESILEQDEFKNHFDGNFTPKKFLKLMEHFEIVAKKSTHPPIEYFMPCILREIPEDDLKNFRMPEPASKKYMEPVSTELPPKTVPEEMEKVTAKPALAGGNFSG